MFNTITNAVREYAKAVRFCVGGFFGLLTDAFR